VWGLLTNMGPGHGWPQWGKCRQISVPGEVVVLGEAQGNVDASERVNISSEGSLSGDV
jgi:hypothetical protein